MHRRPSFKCFPPSVKRACQHLPVFVELWPLRCGCPPTLPFQGHCARGVGGPHTLERPAGQATRR